MVELIQVDIEGFGKFEKSKSFKFKSGINFIYGQNESGKSTLLESILASLFKYSVKNISPFYCWKNDDVCRVSTTYKTDKGEIYRIISDYKNGHRRLEISPGVFSSLNSHYPLTRSFSADIRTCMLPFQSENTHSCRVGQVEHSE